MPDHGYEKADSMPVPSWWLDEANQALADSDMSQRELAERAAEAVGRQRKWDKGTVSRFLRGENTTREMTIGIAAVLDLPLPYVEARNIREARALRVTARKFDEDSNPDPAIRLSAIDQVVARNQEVEKDQTRPVASSDGEVERGTGGKRTGRSPRGRTPTS